MDNGTAIIRFQNLKAKTEVDVDIPLNITANELVVALNDAYNLGIDVSDVKKCYLVSENPVAFLKGNKILEEYGIRNGSIIYFKDR